MTTHDDSRPEARRADGGEVAAVLERLRAGVRQRRAELATLGERSEAAELALLELKGHELVEEPAPVSPRPVVGRLLVFLRRAVFHLGLKWYARPVREQQNAFNQAASRLIQDLSRQVEELGREVTRLSRRLAALEAARDEALRDEAGGGAGEPPEPMAT